MTTGSNNNVDKNLISFSDLPTEKQIEKLKKRKINFAKLMHDESDTGDKACLADEINLIDLRIKNLKKKIVLNTV
ncbi:MAG: hypothetical protein NT052_00345 [Candidatus Shapirobacteria bacterium]|nr:hypothetical protein [Candidatus Shapirobacteria bacterium]